MQPVVGLTAVAKGRADPAPATEGADQAGTCGRCWQQRDQLRPDLSKLPGFPSEQGKWMLGPFRLEREGRRGRVPFPCRPECADNPCESRSPSLVEADLGLARNVGCVGSGRGSCWTCRLETAWAAWTAWTARMGSPQLGCGGEGHRVERVGRRFLGIQGCCIRGRCGGNCSPCSQPPLRLIAFPDRGFDFVATTTAPNQGMLSQRRRSRTQRARGLDSELPLQGRGGNRHGN
jgi:hypothetical protein